MKKLDIVLPVLNEENILKKNVMFLYEFLVENLPYIDWKIVVVDNGSSDFTQSLGEGLCKEKSNIQYIRLEERGRGRALKESWGKSKADLVSYMDIDLSTDLNHFSELISAILYDNYDLAIDFGHKLRTILGINKPPMAPHGLILSENEAIPSMMLFRLLLGLFEPILCAFLMQIRPQGSGPRKLVIFLFSL